MAGSVVSLYEWQQQLPLASDKVSVRKLALTVNAGYDAWGRPKAQPVAISVTLSLEQKTSSAAASDTVDTSTVHYGSLSKGIIAKIEKYGDYWVRPEEIAYAVADAALEVAPSPMLLSSIEIDVRYTKSTHFGEGLSVMSKYRRGQDMASPVTSTGCDILHLSRLQIPALIGVNSNERFMKQKVIISVWIDRVNRDIFEHCFELEQLLFKTVEESSYETLEALAEELAIRIIKYFILACQSPLSSYPEVAGVRVKIEKPSAVPAAETPAVELYRSANSQEAFGRRMISELGGKRPQIPFPLKTGLNDFLEAWKLD